MPVLSFNIMRILALKDDRNAQLDLGRFYFGGDGVEQIMKSLLVV